MINDHFILSSRSIWLTLIRSFLLICFSLQLSYSINWVGGLPESHCQTDGLVLPIGVDHMEGYTYTSAQKIPNSHPKNKLLFVERGVTSIILRPTFYLENFSSPWMKPDIIRQGVVAYPLLTDFKASWICADDAAVLSIAALNRPDLQVLHLTSAAQRGMRPTPLCGEQDRALVMAGCSSILVAIYSSTDTLFDSQWLHHAH